MVRISVVIPTHNRPDFLEENLRKLTGELRGAGDVEIVVVDDGSEGVLSERVRRVCSAHGARLVSHKRNRGMAVARNTGFAAGAGKWIAFLDDDVCVNPGWFTALLAAIDSAGGAAGIEGRIEPSGDGVWDREVQNLRGGLYLTSHIVYRADILRAVDGFDGQFEHEGPFAEDHELAARVLARGCVVFAPSMSVTHRPRKVALVKYLWKSPGRILKLLRAEHYFFMKHPDRYHAFRHARTFWGTYADILSRHLAITLRRQSPRCLLRHPLQALTMLAGTLAEQLAAWVLVPYFLLRHSRRAARDVPRGIDMPRTLGFWGLPSQVPVAAIRLRGSVLRAVAFPVLRRPVYDSTSALASLNARSCVHPLRLVLRIDDVFLDMEKSVRGLCAACAQENIPFLAAVPGRDFRTPAREPLLRLLRESGGMLALHGFEHNGQYGPYQSEILQMSRPEIEAMIARVTDTVNEPDLLPRAFVPPFNAITWEQVRFLVGFLPIVCGGPESARFTGRLFGPLAVGDRGWYVPSFHPFYGDASAMLGARGIARRLPRGGYACVCLHMPVEASDNFGNLRALVRKLKPHLSPWDIFLGKDFFR